MNATLASLVLSIGLLQRSTTLGVVEGIREAGLDVDAWLGIPYAAPPTRDRRWMPPATHPGWTTLRRADRFGASCAQIGGFQGPGLHEEPFGLSVGDAFGKPVGSEDCLTLNIWRPSSDSVGLPVIVFVHGGANVAGYTADPLYRGARLAKGANAVVVTLNYRLGVLGWFAHPALDPMAGNLGLLDIIKALEFVRANARTFGGDPDNVTLVGQSAGAVNAFGLMLSPLAEGLFHKVVALSGAIRTAPVAARHEYANHVLAQLLLADRTATDTADAQRLTSARGLPWVREYLLSRPTAALLTAATGITGAGFQAADGLVLPPDPTEVVRQGHYRALPLWIGKAADEGKFFVQGVYRVSDAERFRMMLQYDPDHPNAVALADVLKPEHVAPGAFERAAEPMGTVVTQLIDGTLSLFASRQQNVYASRFEWNRQNAPWHTLIGAMHGIDLPFLFGNFGPSFYSASFGESTRSEREALSAELMSCLAAFARVGNPSVPNAGITWLPWSSGGARAFGAR